MRTLRTIGIIGSALAIFFSGTVAFAERLDTNASVSIEKGERSASTTLQIKERGDDRVLSATTSARIELKREKAKERLADLRDTEKQKMAVKIAAQFNDLNKKWTDHFTDVLNRYDAVLVKIQSRADSATSTGLNGATVSAAIQVAKTAVVNARAAVALQAAKDYTLDTSSITVTATSTSTGQDKLMQGLRKSFQALHSTLFKDLFLLRDGPMKDTRKAVESALQALKTVPGVEAKSSASAETSNQ